MKRMSIRKRIVTISLSASFLLCSYQSPTVAAQDPEFSAAAEEAEPVSAAGGESQEEATPAEEVLFNAGAAVLESDVSAEADASDPFYDYAAGAAEAVEADTLPSEYEILQMIAENNAWKEPGALVMANVNYEVNVRREPDESAERAGVLYKDCGGNIIEYTDTWTKLCSGDLTGWVRNDFLLFGDEAQALADEVGSLRATVTADSLNVRKDASTDAGVYGMVAQGEIFDVVDQRDGWVVIDYEGDDGYISEEYTEISFSVDSGETVEAIAEREAQEAAERAAQLAAEAEAARRAAEREAEREQYYGVYAASASDVVLLGALIYCEAGNQPYEGKVAVGACVMNRVRSPFYPNTIYGVIYASRQFTPAGTGAVDRRISLGVPDSCLQAAQEALNGYSNIGDATHFRRAGNHDGIIIGAHVFW